MARDPYPWYWAWRGWRASTWALLFWTALLWRKIVLNAASDELTAFALVLVYLLGVGVIGWAWRREAGEYRDARPADRVRKALPFVAAVVLIGVVFGQISATWTGGPSELESAVESDWRGDSYYLWFAPVDGDPGQDDVFGSKWETPDDVRCEQTDATVRGAPVHTCTIVYCDHDDPFGGCRQATESACAALVDGRLVLVSKSESAGPPELRNELALSRSC